MSSADALLGIVSRMEPHGTLMPGKPSKARKVKRVEGGPIAKAYRRPVLDDKGKRIGVSRPGVDGASQTRSARIDIETPADIAAAMGYVRDPIAIALIAWIALPTWMQTIAPLYEHLRERVKVEGETGDKIVASVMMEVRTSDACDKCGCSGREWSVKRQEWGKCRSCHGTGWRVILDRDRAKRVGASRRTYKVGLERHYKDLYQYVTERTDSALRRLERARG